MPAKVRFHTSESVTEGHPDKMADQISDAVLDAIMAQDPNGRVACETLLTTGLAFVAGEITTDCYVEIAKIVRETISGIGYVNADWGFDAATGGVMVSIQEQSPDIAQGVGHGAEVLGAGDQGIMFGYATRETPQLMPAPILYAHQLVQRLAHVRKTGQVPYLRPDGKSQITVRYEDDRPVSIEAVVVSAQHAEDVDRATLEKDIEEKVIRSVLPQELMRENTRIHINPTGKFVRGGPAADTGLTGRKIIVDTYGGVGHHGGGCFSGKDPTKVDRSASYMMRYVAKNMVAAGLAEVCEVQVAYAIGVAEPVALAVETFGTGAVPDQEIAEHVRRKFDLRPGAIIDRLKLRRPIYRKTAAYGHFGREDPDFTWERTDVVDVLRELLP